MDRKRGFAVPKVTRSAVLRPRHLQHSRGALAGRPPEGYTSEMGNASWACFDCRQVMRRPTHHRGDVLCSRCGLPSRYLGYKIRIPAKSTPEAWTRLRESMAKAARSQVRSQQEKQAREQHDIEHQIADLQGRQLNAERTRLINALRKQLKNLKNHPP